MQPKLIYLIGSLRNPEVPHIGNQLREKGFEVFDDWFAGGKIADDEWQAYELVKGSSYRTALRGFAARHVFEFDLFHLNRANLGLLVMPAGKSGHLELGYLMGQGKPGYVLFPEDFQKSLAKLPENWVWLAGLYEGEGSVVKNSKGTCQLTVTSTDWDIIQRLRRISGVGSTLGPYIHKKNLKYKPQYRWAVYKNDDVLYVIKGIWNHLGLRRQGQCLKALHHMGLMEDDLWFGKSPAEFRYDVMYQFANDVFFDLGDCVDSIARNHPTA